MGDLARTQQLLAGHQATWLVTGAAGFIGSHLVENLLASGQTVVGLDNFATGTRANLDAAIAGAGDRAQERFRLIEGDIRRMDDCLAACNGIDYVLHQAALASVPQSMAEPTENLEVNVGGTVNVLIAGHHAGVRRVVFASSSSIYGDTDALPVAENTAPRPQSPYAASKYSAEIYAATLAESHGLHSVGLRYFNVYGPRQRADGPYAAVIPRWIDSAMVGQGGEIYGDGRATRDFCHVADAVQANVLAAMKGGRPFAALNIGSGRPTAITDLYQVIMDSARSHGFQLRPPRHGPPRAGDILHSYANIEAARQHLGFEPKIELLDGIRGIFKVGLHREPSSSA